MSLQSTSTDATKAAWLRADAQHREETIYSRETGMSKCLHPSTDPYAALEKSRHVLKRLCGRTLGEHRRLMQKTRSQ
jgi:hypothetical protein